MFEQRIMDLETKLAARDGKPGFKQNCAAIKAELARLRGVPDSKLIAAPTESGEALTPPANPA